MIMFQKSHVMFFIHYYKYWSVDYRDVVTVFNVPLPGLIHRGQKFDHVFRHGIKLSARCSFCFDFYRHDPNGFFVNRHVCVNVENDRDVIACHKKLYGNVGLFHQ